MAAHRMNWRHRLSVAPMMKRTDRHFRWLVRQLSSHTLLYTEMVVTGAVLRGDADRFLGFDPSEQPLALQLGGDDPSELAACAEIAESRGFHEVNLNVGCPSDRVQSGCFGAVLMRTPEKVASAVRAMRAASSLPVTVKHRIGVDELNRYEDMRRFVDAVADAGADRFTVHARCAWLQGLSPRENRHVPPLRYADVHRLKAERRDLCIEINGGITTLDQALDHLRFVDAVMVGRAAYDNPWMLAEADERVFDQPSSTKITRRSVAMAAANYIEDWVGTPHFKPHHVTRHLSNLYNGVVGARAWRRVLATENSLGGEAVHKALNALEQQRSVPDDRPVGQKIDDQHPSS